MSTPEEEAASKDLLATAADQAHRVIDVAAARAAEVVDTAAVVKVNEEAAKSVIAVAVEEAVKVIDHAASKALVVIDTAEVKAKAKIDEQAFVFVHSLGRLEGVVDQLNQQSKVAHDLLQTTLNGMDKHILDDKVAFNELQTSMKRVAETVDRIRKPVDTFLSIRNFLIGLAALLAAGVAVFYNAPHMIWLFFHPPS